MTFRDLKCQYNENIPPVLRASKFWSHLHYLQNQCKIKIKLINFYQSNLINTKRYRSKHVISTS